jgi:hypothetical protein
MLNGLGAVDVIILMEGHQDSRWREIRACNDNACEESKGQNFHDSLLDLTFLIVAVDPKAPIYWYLISRQRQVSESQLPQ